MTDVPGEAGLPFELRMGIQDIGWAEHDFRFSGDLANTSILIDVAHYERLLRSGRLLADHAIAEARKEDIVEEILAAHAAEVAALKEQIGNERVRSLELAVELVAAEQALEVKDQEEQTLGLAARELLDKITTVTVVAGTLAPWELELNALEPLTPHFNDKEKEAISKYEDEPEVDRVRFVRTVLSKADEDLLSTVRVSEDEGVLHVVVSGDDPSLAEDIEEALYSEHSPVLRGELKVEYSVPEGSAPLSSIG